MRNVTRIILLLGFILVVYGYLSRALSLYFFWDSKPFGWIVLFIGLLFYLVDVHRSRRELGKKTIWLKAAIGFIIFGLIVFTFVVIVAYTLEPYKIAIDYLRANTELKEEVGNVKGFGLIPSGSVESSTVNGLESGRATFFLTVFGDKKFKDININLQKTPQTGWTVISIYR